MNLLEANCSLDASHPSPIACCKSKISGGIQTCKAPGWQLLTCAPPKAVGCCFFEAFSKGCGCSWLAFWVWFWVRLMAVAMVLILTIVIMVTIHFCYKRCCSLLLQKTITSASFAAEATRRKLSQGRRHWKLWFNLSPLWVLCVTEGRWHSWKTGCTSFTLSKI